MFHTLAADFRFSRIDAAEWRGGDVAQKQKRRRKKDREGQLAATPRDTEPEVQSTKSEVRSIGDAKSMRREVENRRRVAGGPEWPSN